MSEPRRVIDLFIPHLTGGGAQRVGLNLAAGLGEIGVTARIITVSPGGQLYQAAQNVCEVVTLERSRVLTAIPALAGYIRHTDADAIISFINYGNVAAVIARAISRRSVPLILTEHNSLSLTLFRSSSTWRQRILRGLMALAYRHAEGVVAVSHNVLEEVRAYFPGLDPERSTFIENAVILPSLAGRIGSGELHGPTESNDDGYLVSVGRLAPQKGYDLLLDALAMIPEDSRPGLRILGSGELEGALRAHAVDLGLSPDEIFLGFCEDPYPVMARAEAFVMSSRWEGLPTVLIEALAIGVPIIATDCVGGVRQVLEGGDLGTVVPPDAPEALAEAIRNRSRSQESIERGQLAARKYAAATVAQRYLAFVDLMSLRNQTAPA